MKRQMIASEPEKPRAKNAGWRSGVLRPSPPRVRAAFALSLTFLCPGWGHVYAGQRVRGLYALAIVAGVVLPAWIVAGARIDGPLAPTLALSGAWLLWIALPFDAARCAFERRPPGGASAACVAALFLLAGLGLLSSEISLLRSNAAGLFSTPTTSMVPALLPGDVFLADVRPSERRHPVPGEIVIFRSPDQGGLWRTLNGVWGTSSGDEPFYAKRVAATAGSVVSLHAGRLTVDGRERVQGRPAPGARHHFEKLGGRRYAVEVDRGDLPLDFGPFVVPEGHVFVLGDSRGRSVDSRSFGAVPLDAIEGHVVRLVWSRDPHRGHMRWERIGRVLGSLPTTS